MPKFYQTKKFKALQEKWTEKLEKSGFEDIEHNEDTLTEYTTRFRRHPHYVWELKSAYYSMCSSFLLHYQFESKTEMIIWEYHTNGIGTRPIAKILNKIKRKKTDWVRVSKIIKRLETTMKETYLTEYSDENEVEQ